ncbi:MAG: hypothetical protein CMP59_00500 [Flavobacteriales bacterium]|nr:hypothetical protein [Flavobacteriales bacterium]|tara:strand:- start:883 stop:1683 length:801 start_codon:yes stop_codon:yes gene_type:complete
MKLIALHSMPRSGSTWLGSIIDSCPVVSYKMQPLFSYSLKGSLTDDSSLNEIIEFKKRLITVKDNFIDQESRKQEGIVPSFKKSTFDCVAYKETRYHFILDNLLQKDKEVLLIGLIRNPFAHLHSWFNAPKEFDADWKIEEEWKYGDKKNLDKREEYYGFEKWKELGFMFHDLKSKYGDKVFIMEYSELIDEPIKKTKELFSFLDIPYTDQTNSFLTISRSKNNLDPYGVYKTKENDDSWKGKIPDFIIDNVHSNLKGTVLERYLK